jgi:hypothetical protein
MSSSGSEDIAYLPASDNVRVGAANALYRLFLFTTALMPLASLYWDVNLFWVKANWAPYPIFLFAVLFIVFLKQRTPGEFTILIFLTAFYLLLAFVRGAEMEHAVRFSLAVLPLTFYFFFDNVTDSGHKYFWWIYCGLMIIPLYYSYLQYTGRMGFSEFDSYDGEVIGRISGGYQKPMNLIAFIVPIFLLGFYLWKVKGRWIIGGLIVFGILTAIFFIGHRTSLIAFVVMFISLFFMRTTQKVIYTYYRYFLNFFVPIAAFISFRIMFSTVGLLDKLRGRVPIWELHAWQYFDQGPFNLLLGSQKVLLDSDHRDLSVVLNEEVHNNSFRTIVVFGLLGFFLYCVFMRKIVMHIRNSDYPPRLKFVMYSGFTYFIFYTITNEPMYYGSVLWPVLIWIFLVQSMPSFRRFEKHSDLPMSSS